MWAAHENRACGAGLTLDGLNLRSTPCSASARDTCATKRVDLRGMAAPRSNAPLEKYESKTSGVMVTLAVIYFGVYSLQVLWTQQPETVELGLGILALAIWAAFVLDLCARVYLAPRRLRYLAQHPLDVIAVVVPMFRALRVLRIFTAGQWFVTRGKHLAIGRTYLAVGVGAAFIGLIAAMAFYDAERTAPGTMVDSFGDALWWSISTMSTVGYGDTYPTTTEGRLVAAGLMVVGISLLGVVTATVAAWFINQTRVEPQRRFRPKTQSRQRMQPSRRLRQAPSLKDRSRT